MAGWWWVTRKIGNVVCSKIKYDELQIVMSRRLMTVKAPNRAAVHGTKLPVTETIDREEAEKESNKGREEKEKKRGRGGENCGLPTQPP